MGYVSSSMKGHLASKNYSLRVASLDTIFTIQESNKTSFRNAAKIFFQSAKNKKLSTGFASNDFLRFYDALSRFRIRNSY